MNRARKRKPNHREVQHTRPGSSQIAFVQAHMHLAPADVLTAARAAGVKITSLKRVYVMRTTVRTRAATDERYAYSETGPSTSASTSIEMAHDPAPATIEAPRMPPKEATFRKLIFELGWDRASEIFSEFHQMYEQMNG